MPVFKKKVQPLNARSMEVSNYRRRKNGTLDYATALTLNLSPLSPDVKRESEAFKAKVLADRKKLGLE